MCIVEKQQQCLRIFPLFVDSCLDPFLAWKEVEKEILKKYFSPHFLLSVFLFRYVEDSVTLHMVIFV